MSTIQASPTSLDSAPRAPIPPLFPSALPPLMTALTPDAARFDEFVMSKQGLSARSRSRGRPPLDRVPESPYRPENQDLM